ncbi:hypothetical protein [Mixta calida]|uniref:hypothetical protein n=1 Tax=Mixta calida TaxID=665913 RepID=UPI00290E7CEC|nr:hypothetical protein [Mixta calida]MDU6539286.1 hypothetical protein [Mixta calida]
MRDKDVADLYRKMMPEIGEVVGRATGELLREGGAITNLAIREQITRLYADKADDVVVQMALALLSTKH